MRLGMEASRSVFFIKCHPARAKTAGGYMGQRGWPPLVRSVIRRGAIKRPDAAEDPIAAGRPAPKFRYQSQRLECDAARRTRAHATWACAGAERRIPRSAILLDIGTPATVRAP